MKKRKSFIVVSALVSFITWQGCEKESDPGPVDCDNNPVMLEATSVQDADCAVNNGSVEVTASGGGGTYTFRIGNQPKQTSTVFNGLAAGEHEIIAVDQNECADTLTVSVKSKSGLTMSVESINAGCKTPNGSLTVMAQNGTEPYQFKLAQGGFSGTNTFSALQAGEYLVVTKDASGCEVTQTVRIKSGVSFAGSIAGIIETKCAVSGCHNGTQAPDFRVFKNVQNNAAQVKTLTGNGTMPKNGSLTQEQINLIACWVDDGAPEN
jgi:hypothetical protein